ncbi:MAG: hypothetical protein VR78_17155 [Hoeflea sp. BRH_c9]|nr:MAG: hypothetical protein VR78_17155 [Hoeflea sp. BRH_c9]
MMMTTIMIIAGVRNVTMTMTTTTTMMKTMTTIAAPEHPIQPLQAQLRRPRTDFSEMALPPRCR